LFVVKYNDIMYLVTKRIDFCYGHRLLDYDGICKHPHGHNAPLRWTSGRIASTTATWWPTSRDIKRIVKGWIDRELDHKMILRHDDPLVKPLEALGEPIYKLDSNPTVERIAKLIFDKAREQGWIFSRSGVGNADVIRCVHRRLIKPHIKNAGLEGHEENLVASARVRSLDLAAAFGGGDARRDH
jgi:6-pyruvoyltetrahydropterin/6-carboxytetrahydropterin synthase